MQFVCRTSSSNLFWFQGKWRSLTEIVTELELAPTDTAFLTAGPFIHSNPATGLNILIGWHHTEQKHTSLPYTSRRDTGQERIR